MVMTRPKLIQVWEYKRITEDERWSRAALYDGTREVVSWQQNDPQIWRKDQWLRLL